MAKYVIEDTTLVGIADAIREKEGSTAAIPVPGMKQRILDIISGSVSATDDGAGNVTLTITGNNTITVG